VFNTIEIAHVVRTHYSLDDKPWALLSNHVPLELYSDGDDELWIGGVLYHGALTMPGDYPADQSFNDFYNQAATVAQLKENGIDTIIYSYAFKSANGKRLKDFYKKTGAWMYPPLDYHRLLRRMSSFDFGLVGNVLPTRVWDMAMPNKLYDCIAGGLPIAAVKAKTAGAFVERHGIGINCDTAAEIKDRCSERDHIRRTLVEKRVRFSMDANIQPLLDLYAKIA